VTETEANPPDKSPADVPPDESTGNSPALTLSCVQCGAVRAVAASYCGDCGYIFLDEAAPPAVSKVPDGLVGGRYRLTRLIGERDGVARFRGEDVGDPDNPFPVIVVREITPTNQTTTSAPTTNEGDTASMFEFDLPAAAEQATEEMPNPAQPGRWPGVAWEQSVLLRAAHLSLPRLIDSFVEDSASYLVEEVPNGTALWDAWDREGITNRERFAWLIQLAEAIERLHVAGAILEGLRPEMIVVGPTGVAILADLTDLLPMPLPGDVPLRGGFSTAPELLLDPVGTDERADLYAFGALMYALLMGRELADLDFTLTGMPRHFLERMPDANPFLARVMAKTFVRDPNERFPTEDGAQTDPTGFRELIAALEACRRNLDRMRVDIAVWSTTGMVRTGNEDAVAFYHSGEGRLNDEDEAALVLLADGMGGMECGEVAAAITLQALRECLLALPPFAPGLPATPLPETVPPESGAADSEPPSKVESEPVPQHSPQIADKESPERTAEAYAERITGALREANRRVFEAARANTAARGMGCTAEVVLVDGGAAIVGHVGDSRVYRMRRGKLVQVTRDHTLVRRLIEIGQLTEEEAENHPRRSELHQAIGGRPEVYPDVYGITLEPGDWILVCTDGLSNQASVEAIQTALRDSRNAEQAARRLINMALYDGAVDNVTVAVLRFA
jgi:protein phosphatase